MMRRWTLLLLFALGGLALPLRAGEVLVFAAASLRDALRELGEGYEKAGGDKVQFNFEASSLLARQLLNGAPADLFASADEAQMERLARAKLLLPKAVPNGVYARQYFEKLKLWRVINYKLIPAENVRASLAAVEAGNADVAIVYKSDLSISKKVRLLFEVPLAEGPAIRYPFSVLNVGKNPEGGRRFLDYLNSDASQAVFQRYGFLIPGKP
jgi:molybdate transport system substrate-binding protein